MQGLAVAWESLFAFDTLVFILTLVKTFKNRRQHERGAPGGSPIVRLVLRDGRCFAT